jgi:hypothetical protein
MAKSFFAENTLTRIFIRNLDLQQSHLVVELFGILFPQGDTRRSDVLQGELFLQQDYLIPELVGVFGASEGPTSCGRRR